MFGSVVTYANLKTAYLAADCLSLVDYIDVRWNTIQTSIMLMHEMLAPLLAQEKAFQDFLLASSSYTTARTGKITNAVKIATHETVTDEPDNDCCLRSATTPKKSK